MCNVIKVRPTSRGVRLWIEGNKVNATGLVRGARYDRSMTNGCIVLSLNADGKYKVSGKTKAGVDHPVIDLSAKEFRGFPVNADVLVSYGVGVITYEVQA